ncbi:hypothetical protein LSH36_101g05011 [Paralvinella palmiformis]|uniref:VPS9 domain-containing protein n=1 Tax=Paralvinella palmiformis TaxID=53620 RepID=A0AAD9K0F6_9ANNE|nr:hypothetical protein LSH36_101g05011 [Paralvinella palmiformis]
MQMDNKLRQIVKQVAEAQNFDSIGNYKDAYVKYLQSTENVIHQLLDNAVTTAEISCDANTKKMVSVGVMCIQRAEDLLNNKILIVSTSPTSSGISLSLVERQIMAAYRARMSGLSRRKATDMSLSLQRRLAENIAIGKAREKAVFFIKSVFFFLAKKKQERRVRLEAEAARRFATTTTVISKEELERRELYTKMWLLKWRQKLKDDPGDCVLIEKIVHLILRTTSHPLTQLLYTYQNKIYDVAQTLLKQWNCSHEMSEECQIIDGHASRSDSSLLSSQSTDVADDVTRSVLSISSHPDDHGLLDRCDNSGHNEGQENSSGKIHGITSGSTESSTDNVECSHCDNMKANRPLNELQHESDHCDDNHSTNRDSLSSVSLQEMDREAILHHLANVAADIQDYLEKLITMFIFVYESLDHATGRDCCYSCIAELFYKPVWSLILSLFRVVYKKEECQIQAVMHKYRNSSPFDLQIPRKFCLLPEDSLLMPEGYQPYQTAISELQTIVNTVSPLTKLECIVHVSRAICDCVEEFYTNNKNDIPNIGADDLLPMLSYVVIKTNLPQIYAECQALEELIHEGYLMGEEGYCLTSLETAMKYVISL